MATAQALKPDQREELLSVLKTRFEENAQRHPGLDWAEVQERLERDPGKLRSLHEMEQTALRAAALQRTMAFDDAGTVSA